MTKMTREDWREWIGKDGLKLRNGRDAVLASTEGRKPGFPLIVEYLGNDGRWYIQTCSISGAGSSQNSEYDLMPPVKTYQWYAYFAPDGCEPDQYWELKNVEAVVRQGGGYYKTLSFTDERED